MLESEDIKSERLDAQQEGYENMEHHVKTNLIEEEGEIVIKLKESKEKVKELVEKGQEHRDKELMKIYPNEIDEDSEANKRKKKEVLRNIQKSKPEIMIFTV